MGGGGGGGKLGNFDRMGGRGWTLHPKVMSGLQDRE